MYQAGAWAGGNVADARHERPAVTAYDSLHVLYANVKKHRFLSHMEASCVDSSVAGSASQELHVAVDLKGGDGQNAQTVNADPTFTDVFLEMRISPTPEPFVFEVTQGARASSRDPSGGFTGGTGRGFIVKAVSTGNGRWEAWLQPIGGYASGSATY